MKRKNPQQRLQFYPGGYDALSGLTYKMPEAAVATTKSPGSSTRPRRKRQKKTVLDQSICESESVPLDWGSDVEQDDQSQTRPGISRIFGSRGHPMSHFSVAQRAAVAAEGDSLSLPTRVPNQPRARSKIHTTASKYPQLRPSRDLNPHPAHWYDDGNLLVELDGVHFKLLWSLMAKQSAFFQARYDSWKTNDQKIGLMRGKEMVNLDGRGVTAENFAQLLDTTLSADDRQDSLRTVLSILSTSHALSFKSPYDRAKSRLIEFWTIGDDFSNLPTITNYSMKDVKDTFILSRTCQIYGVLKPALYALIRLSSLEFKDGELDKFKRETGVNLLQGREHLSDHWAATNNRLYLSLCAHRMTDELIQPSFTQRPAPPPRSCASNDVAKGDAIHFRLLHKNGFYHKFMNDPLVGIHNLKSQLIPPQPLHSQVTLTHVGALTKKRKQSGEQELVGDDSAETKASISPWADPEGGYCDDCLRSMWVICSEAMDECWEKLDGCWATDG
ncbi:hypothetical protein BDN72DRAFT_900873 [Pluteus cervinus]|uniref:Uncharacterized protein n=1 Tax=Pluteus cervinus TaxID=181527 RepID=A0ACD3AHQ5_9AGAR|nr:hypothetical protein BDN72DRAFT_900873 [Pluteus cervinus]